MKLTKKNYPIHFAYAEYVARSGDALGDVDPQLADTLLEMVEPGAWLLRRSVTHQPIDMMVDGVLLNFMENPARYTAAADSVVNEILRPIASVNRKAELMSWVYDIDLGPHATDTDVRDAKKYLLKRAMIAASNSRFAYTCIYRRDDLNEEGRDEPSALYRLFTMCAVHALGDHQL